MINSPNVRYIEESYGETWPTVTQYGSIHFGPVKEGVYVVLPMPLDMSRLPVEEQWAWLQDPRNQASSHAILLGWHMRLGIERALLAGRLRASIIERVNEALKQNQVRNAARRNPQTGEIA